MSDVIVAPWAEEKPIVVKEPRKKRKRFGDMFSIQLAPKMISEQKARYGGKQLVISIPQVDLELAKELTQKVSGIYLSGASVFEQEGKPSVEIAIYHCPASSDNIQAVYKFGKTHRFVFDGDMAIRALSTTDEGRELERMSTAKSNSVIEIPKLAYALYGYQRAGVAYMLKSKRCLNADEMGLGKTIQAIGATATAKAYPVLVITPATLKINWQKEWTKWCPKRTATTIIPNNHTIKTITKSFIVKKKRGKPATRKNWEVVIVNYDRLEKYLPELLKIHWKAIILDESHYTKNRGAKRTKACIELIDTVCERAQNTGEESPYIWLLSGTPIKAKPDQLIPQLRIMQRLDDFGGRGHFQRKYCWIHETNGDDPANLNLAEFSTIARKRYENLIELNSNLRSLCFIRREKSEVLPDLPPKTRSTILFELNSEYRKIYERVETDTIAYIMDKAEKDEKFLQSIKHHPALIREKMISERRASAGARAAQAEILVKIEHLKQTAAIGKLERAYQWIEDFLESDEKLVVFCTHRVIASEILERFNERWMKKNKMSPAVKIVGGQSDIDRNASVEAFQNDPKCRLLISSNKAGGIGLTLTASSNVAFLELAWGPADHDQAEDRCHRIGQNDNVTAWYLLAKDTIEEKIAQLIESKRLVVNATTDGDPTHNIVQGSILGDLLKLLVRGKVVLV